MVRNATSCVPDWSVGASSWFELHKPGYMKRFIMCATPEDAIALGHLTHMAECRLVRCEQSARVTCPPMHYFLPDDNAQATLEIITYFTAPHHEGDHLRGRLSD